MSFRSTSRQASACLILSIAIGLLPGASAFTQSPQAEYRFQTQENPRIVISSASTVSIIAWASNEVSMTAQVSGASIKVDEVRIKTEKNKLDITCEPLNPDRKIFLTLRVPAKAVVEIRDQENKVEIREPAWQITVIASRDLIQLNVPESASLDMQEASNAMEHRQIGQGGSMRIGIGKKRLGTGPPFVKVTAPTTQIIVARGFIPPATQFPRNPTIAATTIARRTSSMSRALRRSNPQLIRPQSDQPASVNLPGAEEGSLKLETHLVNLNVSATDNAGKSIPDLKREDFSVYEDGVRQQISFFSPERSPFNLVLLIDLSGSMKGEIELIKETALHFLDVISAQDSVAVVTFSNDVTVVSQLTKDRDDLRDSIEFMLAPTGGTAFYDALGYALVEVLRKVKGQRNAVIAITDGEDNILQSKLLEKLRPGGMRGPVLGSFLTFEELLDGATESDALIYPLHLSPTQPQVIVQSNVNPPPRVHSPLLEVRDELTEIATKQLRSLAEASGGRFYHANRIEDLKGVFERVAAELRTVYSMAYTPTNLNYDGRFRKIRVQVNRSDVLVRTRPGYYGR
ncbi:MAG TPA: VWA domain-containing protein [Blastocatellia bacterium]|nr:VWA domain-containing protein [Blastocatellia bacterium]